MLLVFLVANLLAQAGKQPLVPLPVGLHAERFAAETARKRFLMSVRSDMISHVALFRSFIVTIPTKHHLVLSICNPV